MYREREREREGDKNRGRTIREADHWKKNKKTMNGILQHNTAVWTVSFRVSMRDRGDDSSARQRCLEVGREHV
jgi:hypothetical protein